MAHALCTEYSRNSRHNVPQCAGFADKWFRADVEFRCSCLFQKFPVFKSCEPSVPSGLTVVSWEVLLTSRQVREILAEFP